MLPSMAICGTARNAEAGLGASLAAIDRIREASVASHVVIVTNDNEDNTGKILSEWSGRSAETSIIACDGLIATHEYRLDRLAQARNLYLKALREHGVQYDLLIVLDLDGPNSGLVPDHIVNALASAQSDWIALFANQPVAYYDLHALRHPNWVRSNVWIEVSEANGWLGTPPAKLADRVLRGRMGRIVHRWNVSKYVYKRQYRIDPGYPAIAVESAFGGLGIYRFDAALRAEYQSRPSSREVACEHVAFNRAAASRGGRLYICPSMLNIAPEEHLGPGSGAPIPSHLLSMP